LTAPQGFVFSLFPVPVFYGPGAAFRKPGRRLRQTEKR
jgi:hypothetical protein